VSFFVRPDITNQVQVQLFVRTVKQVNTALESMVTLRLPALKASIAKLKLSMVINTPVQQVDTVQPQEN
jgi:hypothetical protein